MASYGISPEACRIPHDIGHLATDGQAGVTRHGTLSCLTSIGNSFPNVRPNYLHNIRTERQRWWRTHPAETQAIADDAEVTIESLLCKGCQKQLARLRRAGEWP